MSQLAELLAGGRASKLLRQLIDTAPDAMVMADSDGIIRLVNQQAEIMFGYSRDDLVGKPVELLVPERFREAHAEHRANLAAALKAGAIASSLELIGRRKDGREFVIEISSSALETEGGVLVSSITRDITGTKRAEQRFRAIVESAPDALIVTDREGRIVLVNSQAERLFGYSRAELIGEFVEVLVPPSFRSEHQVHRAGYARAPQARSMGAALELRGRRKDGTEFPVEISLNPFETEDGMLTSSAIRDVTERKRLEVTAARAADRLTSAIESIRGMVALYDAEDRLALCNSAYRDLFGRGIAGAIVGQPYERVIDVSADIFEIVGVTPGAFRARWLEYHRDPIGSLDLKTRDGRSFRLSDRPTLDGSTVSTVWDVTEDVAREVELSAARALAEAASTAKSEFLSSMSHELRTPLNSILGFAQLLKRDKKSPLNERQKEKLDYVLNGGEHLLHLIDDVLDLSRIEVGRVSVSPEPVGVAEVLAETQTTLAPMAGRLEIALLVQAVPPHVSQVIADRTRFSQILINFGSNALKYGRKGGRATLSVTMLENDFVRISVTDDGIGIPQDKQHKVFTPFERAGQETGPIEGTGIGLAISKRLAELMRGRVGFHSVAGEGSEFWIELPAYRACRPLQ